MNEIIGLLGFKGCGKDTAANALTDIGFVKVSYADTLKDMLSVIFHWDRALLSGSTSESRTWRETPDTWWGDKLHIDNFTPRLAMTRMGTDTVRKHFNDNLWILSLEKRISQMGDSKIVITDCRYQNEANHIREMGGRLIRVQKGPNPPWWEYSSLPNDKRPDISIMFPTIHSSEWDWNNIEVDATITNESTISNLHKQILALREEWK